MSAFLAPRQAGSVFAAAFCGRVSAFWGWSRPVQPSATLRGWKQGEIDGLAVLEELGLGGGTSY